MASSSRRSPQPGSMSRGPATSSRRIPRWRRSSHGMLKSPPRFFSLPKRHSAKTLRFEMDQPSANMASGARVQPWPTAVADGPLAIASAGVSPIPEESASSSSTSTESSSDDNPQQRGVECHHSPRRGRRNHSAFHHGPATPHWMPEEIHHYFYDYGKGTMMVSKDATARASALLQMEHERPPQDDGDNARNWGQFDRQPHCVLAMLCFAAVLSIILATMSSNVYSGLMHGAEGHACLMHAAQNKNTVEKTAQATAGTIMSGSVFAICGFILR